MFILKLVGKILLLPVWLILFVIGLAVKMTVQTYVVVRGILGFIFTLLIIATAYCYHDWVQVAFLFSLSVILYLILFAGVFVDTVAMDSSSIITSSHVSPVISPIRIEQEKAKCIQIESKSSSVAFTASRNV